MKYDSLKNDIYKIDDLNFLANPLKDSRIVLLGEPDHGAGTAFEIKTRIIKYLYQELGFRILAFEADFYSTVKKIDAFQNCIYPFWGKSFETQKLYAWINSLPKSDPLHLCGFDCRKSRVFRKEHNFDKYVAYIMNLAAKYKGNKPDISRFQEILKDVLKEEYKSKVSKNDQSFFINFLDSLPCDDGFWKQEIRNLKGYALNAWYEDSESSKYRDGQMADNIEWIAKELFPKEKIIIWAHNFHILKDFSEVYTDELKQDIGYLMGEILSNKFSNKIFSIGITAYSGSWSSEAYIGEYEHLENIVYDKTDCLEGQPFVYNNFDDYFLLLSKNNNSKFNSSALYLNYPQEAYWSNVYDGIIYLKDINGVHESNSPLSKN